MAEFVVKIADERGHLAEQVESGYSEAEVRDRFVQQGFLVYWVKPRGMFSGGFSLRARGKVKQSQFLIFNSQFLTLIKAGLPILNSLDLLIKRQRDPYLQSLLQNVRDRVKGGELLSDAFSGQGAFPKIYTSTLMAGEKSGNMEEVLARYIAFQRMALTFKKKLAVSLVYPTLLVTVVSIMLVFLVTFVVPQFASASSDARTTNVRTCLANIRNQIEVFKAQHNETAPALAGMWTLLTGQSDTTEGNSNAPVGTHLGPYLQAPPINPMNGQTGVTSAAVDAAAGWYYSPGGLGFTFYARNADGSLNTAY